MAIKIATWNIEGRLTPYQQKGKRGTPSHILSEIKRLNADVVVLPEAYLRAPNHDADKLLQEMGYMWHDCKYDDTGHETSIAEWGESYLRVLHRIPVRDFKVHRWGGIRNLPVFTTTDPATNKETCILPIHFDDLTEARQLLQLNDILSFIKNCKQPVIMLGDFNAIWHEKTARFLTSRLFKKLTLVMPSRELRSIMQRVSEMARGSIMQRLMEAGITDADYRHRATATLKRRELVYAPSIRLLQLDHIMTSHSLRAESIKIGRDGGSDHRSVSATISVR